MIQAYAVQLQPIRYMTLAAVHVTVRLLLYLLVDVDLVNPLIQTRANVNVQMAMNAQVQPFEIWKRALVSVRHIVQLRRIVALWVRY